MNNVNKPIIPAERVNTVTEYYFSVKLREIAAMNAAGADVVSLGIGGPDRPPRRAVIDTLAREATRSDVHGYQSYIGLPELRGAYASWYKRYYGVTLNADNEILPLIGSKEGILHTTMAMVNPGDNVLVPNPGYPTYTSVSRLCGVEVRYYDLTEQGDWEPDFEQLADMVDERTRLMWVNYPHMPTGRVASPALFERLVEFARAHGIVVVNDNPYSFILNDKPLSLLAVDGAREVALEMNSLSKAHNMAGWRMGMIAGNRQFISWILRVKSNVDSGQFRPMMLAAVEALNADDAWYAELNAEYAARRVIAERVLDALRCHYDPRQRGLFLWGRVPEGMTGDMLADKVLRDARVFIVPGRIFGTNGERFVRLSLCATCDKLSEALDRCVTCFKA